jgi:hypothetical protein
MEEKNRKLTQECQILTVRILEEKNKMVEIMNEANTMYERGYSGSMAEKDDFNRRKSELKSISDMEMNLRPELLDGLNTE